MENNQNPFKKVFLIIAIYVISSVIIIFIFIYLNRPYSGQQVTINNLPTKDIPSRDIENIKYSLYKTISYNTSINPASITDINIRENSYTDNYNGKTKIHTIHFLVDIPSISQTYEINYQWSPDKNTDLDEWGSNVSCPTKEQLIYPPFDCQDMFTQMAGSNDPIMEILPYYGPHFRITATTADNKVTSVDIKLLICIDSEIPAYKAEAEKWLIEKGIDIKNYNLKFTSCD